ncbi:MAG: hypothetical protein ACD_80C00111G0003 [uncultured bacterium (gcode 4)]|uniref:Uncharacterized protein n=1 Tax=uncultured bacterium (gcode 4) TaxID=1234023 RepID=K1XJ37_9BACT|nr:MAG: hypothetical protein ACD_80C00111G0003 [uncultured bacterium (gcode 4)]
MLKSILKNSIDYMKNDHKIIRLTLATSFFHSLVASLLIILNINTLFARNYENGLYVGKVAEFFIQEINKNHVISRVIGIAIFLFLAYSLVYPIGQAAIIYYLNDKNKSIRKALKKWRKDFFPMFEYGIISLIISPTVYRLTLLKIAVSGGLHGSFTIFLLILRFGVMTLINCLKTYTRYIITLEGKWVYDALIKSFNLSFKSIKESFKYMRIQTILIINFSINLLIIILIPIILIYLAIVFNIIQYPGVKRTMYGLFFLSILFGSYASSMVRAFFAYFWKEIYDNITKK